jgi:citrate lyase subunit beta / citryl-CoA lyase
MQPMRSMLFTPGTRVDRFQKAAATGGADLVVLDLEDAVPPEQKEAARSDAVTAVAAALARRTRSLVGVRINAYPSKDAEADLMVLAKQPPQFIVVPKAESPQDIRQLAARLDVWSKSSDRDVRLVLIIETARGVLGAAELAACPRVSAIALGAEDLAADAGLRRSAAGDEVAVPRALVALAAASARVAALDMVTVDVKDIERVAREAKSARALGYAGKMCLHPDQVEAVHAALRPSADEVAWAKRIVAAAEAGGAGEGGIVVVEGRMVDVPIIRQARRILAEAEA